MLVSINELLPRCATLLMSDMKIFSRAYNIDRHILAMHPSEMADEHNNTEIDTDPGEKKRELRGRS